MLKDAYGIDILSGTQNNRWLQRFNEGDDDVYDQPRRLDAFPLASNTKRRVWSKIREKLRHLLEESEMSLGAIHDILTKDLGMRRVVAKFVYRLFTEERTEK